MIGLKRRAKDFVIPDSLGETRAKALPSKANVAKLSERALDVEAMPDDATLAVPS